MIARAASSSFVMERWLPMSGGPVGNGGGWESMGELGHLWTCHLLLHAWGASAGAGPPCADPKERLGRVRVDSNVDSAAL